MLEETSLDKIDDASLLDLLMNETKNFTAMLSTGLGDRELDLFCYHLNLIINEIKIRREKADPNSYPHLDSNPLKWP